MDALFRNVRESSSPGLWSKGVELARKEAVVGDSATESEVQLRVLTPETGISARVTLFIADADWQCSCPGPDDPCVHVIAAAIALRRARERGEALPKGGEAQGGRLDYRLTRTPEGLSFQRMIVSASGEMPLAVALSAITSGRVAGPAILATPEDLEVDLALDGHRQGVIPAVVMPKLIRALSRDLKVTLDGLPIRLDPEPIGVILEVVDDGPGVRAQGRQDPAIKEVFVNQVALTDDGLRPIILPSLTPHEQRLVREGRFFGPGEFSLLVGELLPNLTAKMPVLVLASKLPSTSLSKPILALELEEVANGMSVQPLLVYGQPKIAEVRGGHLYTSSSIVPIRDLDEERRLKDELYRRHNLSLEEVTILPTAAAVAFVEALGKMPKTAIMGTGAARYTRYGSLTPQVTISETGMALDFATSVGGQARHADPEAVLSAWQRGESLVPLMDGGVAPLPKDWLSKHGARIAEILHARKADGSVAPVLRPALLSLADDLGATPPPGLVAWKRRLDANATDAAMPADLRADLRAYQQVGVRWLLTRRELGLGALLCDDMGLGKTLQAIAALRGPSLVVAPTSVLHNWQNELKRFRPTLSVALYHGSDRQLDAAADVTITTYAILRLDREKLIARTWKTIVLDEAQAIKNPDSQAARAAFSLQSDFRIVLTGTPVENRLLDLWSQMQFANPGLLGTKQAFDANVARPIAQGDVAATSLLRERIKPFILRRLKRDVAPELPARTETVLHVELSAAERSVYEALLLATRKDVVEKLEAGGNVIEALEALLRLRQACCHPALVPGASGETSAKLTLLVDRLDEVVAGGHKALVFSQWTSFLDLMEPALRAQGIPFLRLDGSTADRGAVVQHFQEAEGEPVLLMSLKAGGVGLNLTAADHVILADPWWNPAAEDQAADRAHRIGQERPVLIQRLVALDTVEEKIMALQAKKRELAAAAIDGGGVAAGLSRHDLIALLS